MEKLFKFSLMAFSLLLVFLFNTNEVEAKTKVSNDDAIQGIQNIVDSYYLEHNEYPTFVQPTESAPAFINFYELNMVEKEQTGNYWVDNGGKVFFSTVDSPVGLNVQDIGKGSVLISWDKVEGATGYKVYKTIKQGKGLKYVLDKSVSSNVTSVEVKGLGNKDYSVVSIDENGSESVPGGEDYTAFKPLPPVAIISTEILNPNKFNELFEDTQFILSSKNSHDDFDIINYEWKNKKDFYEVGTHTVELRVQNQFKMWSEWTSFSFEVKATPVQPIAQITMNEENVYFDNMEFTFDSSKSYDPKNYSIINTEWENKRSSYEVGTHTVKVRVQNEYELFSEWASITFEVKATPVQPIASLKVTNVGEIESDTIVNFNTSETYDPKGYELVEEEWLNKKSTYTEGTHTVKYRVKNEYDLWSEWATVTIVVKSSAPVVKFGVVKLTSKSDATYNFNYATWYDNKRMNKELNNCNYSCVYGLYSPSQFSGPYQDYQSIVFELQKGLQSYYSWEGRKYYDGDYMSPNAYNSYFNAHKYSYSNKPVMHSGFTVTGTLKDGSFNVLPNQEVTLTFLNITKKTTSDANGNYTFDIKETDIPKSTNTTYSYITSYTTHWGELTNVTVSANGSSNSQQAIIRTHYLSNYAVYGNLFARNISYNSKDRQYLYNLKNLNVILP